MMMMERKARTPLQKGSIRNWNNPTVVNGIAMEASVSME